MAPSLSKTKIHDFHLQRRACVYIRQSTLFQVSHNLESTERQYNLRNRAIELGWNPNLIDTIDVDQGQSATSTEHREGFQKLAAEIVSKQVGIVLMLEASRLSRSCSDWHRLIEICSITQTLIADETAVYDPRDPNDRLLLGVKGTLSEAELFTLKTRLYEGRWNKAKKGKLSRSIPTGYAKDLNGEWVKDPNLQVQERLNYIFKQFRDRGVARQVLIHLKKENLKIPIRVWGGPKNRQLIWKEPSFADLMRFLKNPSYTGAYVYGACEYDSYHRYEKSGKGRPKFRPLEEWPVCLQNHHEPYISWEEYVNNQHQLHQNWFRSNTKGAPRCGTALLQGIVWCGFCGGKMAINTYSAKQKRRTTYTCNRDYINGSPHVCQSMTSKPIDELIVTLFFESMTPVHFKLVRKAIDNIKNQKQALKKQWDQQLAQSKYEAQLAQTQYDSVDPNYRLVASELERRWNQKLEALQKMEEEYKSANQKNLFSISQDEEKEMEELLKYFPKIWNASTTTDRERKQLLRYAITEVQLDGKSTEGKIEIRIMWRSGAVDIRIIDRTKVGIWAPKTEDVTVDRIRELSFKHTVSEIVEILNSEGHRSAHQKELREHHVLYIARSRGINITTCSENLRKNG